MSRTLDARDAEIAGLKAEVDRLNGGCAISCDVDRTSLREVLREAAKTIDDLASRMVGALRGMRSIPESVTSKIAGGLPAFEADVLAAAEVARKSLDKIEAALSSTGEVIAAKPWDEKRCRVCGWTLAASRDQGCAAPYDCSMRPMPTRMADGSGDTHEFLTRFHAAAKSTGEGGAAE